MKPSSRISLAAKLSMERVLFPHAIHWPFSSKAKSELGLSALSKSSLVPSSRPFFADALGAAEGGAVVVFLSLLFVAALALDVVLPPDEVELGVCALVAFGSSCFLEVVLAGVEGVGGALPGFAPPFPATFLGSFLLRSLSLRL